MAWLVELWKIEFQSEQEPLQDLPVEHTCQPRESADGDSRNPSHCVEDSFAKPLQHIRKIAY